MFTARAALVGSLFIVGVVGPQSSLATAAAPLPAAVIAHPTLVPETPARGYPIVLGTPQYTTTNENCPAGCTLLREAFAADQAGRFIVAGGNFYQVELQDGSVLQQKYFAAWNIDTKQIACPGKFTFNGIVRSFEAAATAGQVYVGGDFTKVVGGDGVERTRNKIALIDLNTCAVSSTFASIGANGKINEIVRSGTRVFVGGDFTSIGGQSIRYVAELNATTGATVPTFKFTFGNTSLASKIRGMGVSPDGSRILFGGRFGTVSDGIRTLTTQTVIAEIANPAAAPVLRNHTFVQQHAEYGNRPTGQSLQDVAISPDATTIGLAYGTATVSDYSYLINAVDGAQPVRWRHSMGDSSTGIAISNNAVYILGHFCKIATGPGTTALMSPKMGLDTCTGSQTIPSGVWRTHTSALSLADGTPLTWNPGADSTFGGQEVTVIPRGLLLGFDGQRVNSIRTGGLAFLDFGPAAEDTSPPGTVTFTAPAAGATVNNPALIAGTATDNVAVVGYRVRIRHSDGRWLQPDGSLNTTAYQFSPTAKPNGSFELSVSMPAGSYTAQAKAADVAGLLSATWASRSFVQSGAEATPPQSTIVTSPASPIPSESPVTISGRATDNVAVSSVTARITNAAGLYLQSNGTLAAAATDYPLTTTPLNTTAVDWSGALGSTLPPGTYTITTRVTDPTGNTATPTSQFTVSAVAPVVTVSAPAAKVLSTSPVTVAGSVIDNASVAAVTAQLTNAAGLILQDDGSFSTVTNTVNLAVTGLGTPSASFTFTTTAPLPIGDYLVSVTGTDGVGTSTTSTRTFSVVARIESPAVTAYTGYSTNPQFFDGFFTHTVGFSFRVTTATQAISVGVHDSNGNGVLDGPAGVPVGIWRQSDRVLIATVTVAKGTVADGGWFYANLPAPVALVPGTTYVIGEQHVGTQGEPIARGGTVVEATGFDYLSPAATTGNGLNFPSTVGGAGGSGMPNLKIG